MIVLERSPASGQADGRPAESLKANMIVGQNHVTLSAIEAYEYYDRRMTEALVDLLVHDISETRRAIHKRMRTNTRLPSLTGSQVELLRVVEARPGVGVGSAARTLSLAGNSVSALINQLVTTGYLRREIDQEDRRAARLYLTPDATKRLRRWRDARIQLVCEALSMLSPEDRDALQNARPALQRLTAALEEAGTYVGPRMNRRSVARRSA